jgi:hypothetical protein
MRRLHVALATACLLVLTACGGSGSSVPQRAATPVGPATPSTSATLAPAPPPAPPPQRACYRLGYDAVLAPTSDAKPADCTRLHTAVAFYVGSYDPSLRVDSDAVHRQVASVCPQRFAAFVGGSQTDRRLSMLRTVWFTPTAEEAAQGAHWFECVAIALRGDQELAFLRYRVAGALDRAAGRAAYGLCGNAEPGTAGFEQRICSNPHSWKALRTVDFPAGRYPGEDHVRSAGQQPCQDAGRGASSDPLNFRWSYQWPSLKQWRAGQTYGVCWAPS